MEFKDISVELYRRYVYNNNLTNEKYYYEIYRPQLLNVSKSGGHRVVSLDAGRKNKIMHYIKPGWIAIEFMNKCENNEPFQF